MRRPAWLTRNLLILTAVSFTQDAASELLYPLLPLFLTGVLAAPAVVVGVVEGVAEATAGIAKYVSGRWSDRIGRKPLTTVGYGLAVVGKAVVAAAWVWPVVLVGRVVDRLGKGIRSAPRDAWIADSVPAPSYGRAFGFHRAGDTLGAVVGPLLGLAALAALSGNIRAAMWVAVVPAVLSVLLVLLARDPRARRRGAPAPSPTGTAGDFDLSAARRPRPRRSPLPRPFWRVATVLVLIAVVNFPDALLLLRVYELGFSTTEVVLAYVLFNVVYAAASYPAGAFSDRWPRSLIYGAGLLAFAVGYLGLGLVDGGPGVWVLIAVYGLFPALTDGVGKAWISSLVDEEHRGRAQGVYQALTNASIFAAGLWAGLAWTAGAGNGVVPLLISGVLGGLAGLALLTRPLWCRLRAL
ncbi:MAG: MFS transporter [Candidatus Nanopelagicales bacterium]